MMFSEEHPGTQNHLGHKALIEKFQAGKKEISWSTRKLFIDTNALLVR